MIEKINHIGIAVKSLENNLPFYTQILGLELMEKEKVEDQKVEVAMIKVGNIKIELLEHTSKDSPIAKFIEKRGEGIHHIAYQSDDISKEIKNLEDNGIKMIDKKPREGAHGTKIAFIHPKSSKKVLTEICEIN